MHIGAADADRLDPHQHLVVAGRRFRLLAAQQNVRLGINQSFHGFDLAAKPLAQCSIKRDATEMLGPFVSEIDFSTPSLSPPPCGEGQGWGSQGKIISDDDKS
jgi:hypothetical protein